LETDVVREIDLDKEIKASGFFEDDDEEMIAKVS